MSDEDRNQRSKELFKLRKQWAEQRDKAVTAASMKKGRRLSAKASDLFPVKALRGSDGPTTVPKEQAVIVAREFEQR